MRNSNLDSRNTNASRLLLTQTVKRAAHLSGSNWHRGGVTTLSKFNRSSLELMSAKLHDPPSFPAYLKRQNPFIRIPLRVRVARSCHRSASEEKAWLDPFYVRRTRMRAHRTRSQKASIGIARTTKRLFWEQSRRTIRSVYRHVS